MNGWCIKLGIVMTSVELLKVAEALMPLDPPPGWVPGKKIINPNWLATIYDPMDVGGGVRTPGAQQMDDFDLRTRTYYDMSKHPPTRLAERGYRAPKLYGLPKVLPAGHYNAGHAANAVWRARMAGRPMPSALGMPALEGALGLTGTPIPRMRAVGNLEMARVLNSWRRAAMRRHPALGRAFRLYSNPANASLLKVIGKALTRIR